MSILYHIFVLTLSHRFVIIIMLPLQTPKAPTWANSATGQWAFTVPEGAAPGAAISANFAFQALHANPSYSSASTTYVLVSSTPQPGSYTPFAVNPTTGDVVVGSSRVAFDASLVYPITQAMFQLTVAAVDRTGLNVTGTVNVTIVSIAPRVASPGVVNMTADAGIGLQVANLITLVWTPPGYNRNNLRYSIVPVSTPTGDNAFVVDTITGIMTVAQAGSGSAPVWQYNTKRVYVVVFTALDSVTGTLNVTSTVTVNLLHVNQVPAWLAINPPIYATEQTAGAVGLPLSSFVSDPDTALGIGEKLSFAIRGGNNDTTFAINNATGQLTVIAGNSPSLYYTANVTTAYYLNITVKDTGIDGPAYTTWNIVQVVVMPNLQPPAMPFSNLTIVEHSVAGTNATIVGGGASTALVAQTPACPGSPSTCDSTFYYSLSPAGSNINQPWPFTLTSVPGVPFNKAVVTVISGQGLINYSPFNGAGLFRTYSGTLTVTEVRAGVDTPLVALGSVQINVAFKAEPPFFDPAASPTTSAPAVTPPPYDAGLYRYHVYVNEHAAAGSNLSFVSSTPGQYFLLTSTTSSPAAALALSKDPWQAGQMTYAITTGGASVAVNAATGALTAAAVVPAFNTQPSFTAVVTATDKNGLTDTATIVVHVVDVNEPAVFSGLYNSANSALLPSSTAIINETAVAGTVVGYVRFTDADVNPRWATKSYGLSLAQGTGLNSNNVPLFAVDSVSGAVTVAGPLDWNDQASFTITATCTDSDVTSAPLTATASFTVNLVQQNRVVITSFDPAISSAAPGSYAYATDQAFSSSYAATNDVLFSTAGSTVLITGTGFGYTPDRMTRESKSQLPVTATFGLTGVEFTAASCQVLAGGNTRVQCDVPVGVGRDLVWKVTVNGQWTSASSTRATSYFPPAISSITTAGNAPLTTTPSSAGSSQTITVTGNYFGPLLRLGSPSAYPYVYLAYGPFGKEAATYVSACTPSTLTPQTTLTCLSIPGFGGNLSFAVYVGLSNPLLAQPQSGVSYPAPGGWAMPVALWQTSKGWQGSTSFMSSSVTYESPVISSITSSGGALDTLGGSPFTIAGTGLGPAGTTDITVQYSQDSAFTTAPVFTATGCRVPSTALYDSSAAVSTSATIVCSAAAGIGAGFYVSVRVGNQVSAPVSTSLSYRSPTITSLTMSSIAATSTQGGQQMVITGTGFGPGGLTLPGGARFNPIATYGPAWAPGRYAAADCTVTAAQTQMTCTTVPGSGAGLLWIVIVAGQSSAPSSQLMSYAPPSISGFSGPGVLAATAGGEAVNITGLNFGPLGTAVDTVTYGPTGSEFTAGGCTLVVAHTLISCATVPGAGAGLSWYVTITGQRSVSPTTAYLAPVIDSFSGPGAVNASANGRQAVTLTGRYFSTAAFLGVVTYGAGGRGYTATGCTVTVPHTEITCYTVPGTGRALQWTVTVGNQTSRASLATTSYAVPSITAIAPAAGPTAGGTIVTITGANFALLASSAPLTVYINNAGLVAPAGAAWYWGLLQAGLPDDGTTTTASWISRLVPATTLNPIPNTATGVDAISFVLPVGFGPSREVFLVAGGVPSNVVTFDYSPPIITNIAPDRLNVTAGMLRLFVEGLNFCTGTNGCGTLLIDGSPVVPLSWSDTRIQAIVRDPATGSGSATVQVAVGGVASNVSTFSTPVPAFDAVTGQGTWGGTTSTLVSTAVLSMHVSIGAPAEVGLNASTFLVPSTAAAVRGSVAGVAGVFASVVDIISVTDLASGGTTVVSSGDPINTMAVPGRSLLAQDGGVNVTITVDVAGSARLTVGGSLQPSVIAGILANISMAVSDPSFARLVAQAVSNATGIPVSQLGVVVDPSSVSSSTTTVTSRIGGVMSTSGGEKFYIARVASLSTVAEADISILLGPYTCTGVTKGIAPDDNIAPAGVLSTSPLYHQYDTYNLSCTTPPGVGAGWPIRVSVPGGTSNADPNFVFSYAAPSIDAILDASDNSISYTARGSNGLPLRGLPTAGTAAGAIRISGRNLGNATALAGVPASMGLIVLVEDPATGMVIDITSSSLTCPQCGKVSYQHDSITLAMPPWQGTGIQVYVSVGGQTDTDPVQGFDTRPPTLVRYRAPTVTSIRNPSTGLQGDPTTGGTYLLISGTDFGAAGPSASVVGGRPVVTLNGASVALTTAFGAAWTQSSIYAVLPEGWGANLPVVVSVAGQTSAGSSTYSYAPPTVTRVLPPTGPTSGVYADGSPVVITVVGTNLGRAGSVQLIPTANLGDPTTVTINVPSSAMLSHNHTHMVFYLPEGAGYDLLVQVVIGGVTSSSVGAPLFSYDPPSITRIASAQRTAAECSSRVVLQAVGSGNSSWYVNRTIYPTYPGCFPVWSDPPVHIQVEGQSFGASYNPIAITVGGKVCPIISHTHTTAICSLPSGMGDAVPVVITVGGRASTTTSAALLAYDAPTTSTIFPNPVNAGVGQVVTLNGHNYGVVRSPVVIFISGQECHDAAWQDDQTIACTAQPDVVGPKNMTILAANRSVATVIYETDRLIEMRCGQQSGKPSYGLRGEVCVVCGTGSGEQTGADCPGGELDYDLTVALPGFWRFNTTTKELCHPLRTHRADAGGPGCPVFVACSPSESCLGNNVCQEAYTGDRCQDCADGFYHVNAKCEKCPSSPYATVIIFVLLALFAMFGAFMLNAYNVNLSLISIGTDWAQIVAMFSRTSITWPPAVSKLFLILSAFNLNLDLIAPECAIKSVTYSGKWLFIGE